MDYFAVFLIFLQLYETSVEGNVVDATLKLTQRMTLNCVYPGTGTITQVTWAKITGSGKEPVAVFNSQYAPHIDEKYKDRVGFVSSSPYGQKDTSLFFNRTSSTDVGLYSCSVNAFPDGIWEKKMKVVPADNFEQTPPSTSTYVATLGQNVTFGCLYTLGGTVQQVVWEMARAEISITIALCNLSKGLVMQNYGSDYTGRSNISCDGLRNSTITIWNISASDEGLYSCHFATDTGNQTMVTSLKLHSGSHGDREFLFIIGGAALAAVFVIIVIITITILCLKKKKRQRQREAEKKRGRKAKAHHANHSRHANSYGRGPICDDPKHGRNVPECQTQALYVNCRDFSRKPNSGR